MDKRLSGILHLGEIKDHFRIVPQGWQNRFSTNLLRFVFVFGESANRGFHMDYYRFRLHFM